MKVLKNSKYIVTLFLIILIICVSQLILQNKTYSLTTSSILCPEGWKYKDSKCYKDYSSLSECKKELNNLNIGENYCINIENKVSAVFDSDIYLNKMYIYVNVYGNGGKFYDVSNDKSTEKFKLKLDYISSSVQDGKIYYNGRISYSEYTLINNKKILSGFSKNKDCNGSIYAKGDYINTSEESNLYACWSDNYGINFISDGALEFENKTIKGNFNDIITLPNVTKEGYKFLGWYDGNGKLVGTGNDSYTISNSITLYAMWTVDSSVEYSNDKYKSCSDNYLYYLDSDNYCVNDKVKNLKVILSNLGYYKGNIDANFDLNLQKSIIKFQTNYGLSISGIANEETISMIENRINNSNFDERNVSYYSITYNANGGKFYDEGGEKKLYYSNNIKPEIINFSPTRDGYTFDGWYLNGELYKFDSNLISDIDLVAKWKKNKNIYVCDKGDVYDSIINKCIKINSSGTMLYEFDSMGKVTSKCNGQCLISNNEINKARLLVDSRHNEEEIQISGNTCNGINVSCQTLLTTFNYSTYNPVGVATLISDDVDDSFEEEEEDDYDYSEEESDDYVDEERVDDGLKDVSNPDTGQLFLVVAVIAFVISLIIILKYRKKIEN